MCLKCLPLTSMKGKLMKNLSVEDRNSREQCAKASINWQTVTLRCHCLYETKTRSCKIVRDWP